MCAMLSALGVVLLYVGSLIEVVDIAMSVIASLACVFAVIEYGKSSPWLVFGVTAVLSLILLPNKSPAVMYTFFFGFYPILKEKFEKMRTVVSWVLKEVVFHIALVLIFIALKYILIMPDMLLSMYVILLIGCELVFVLYDIALTRLISMYVYKIRKRLKLK